jgi:hypothetical protein
MQWTNLGANGYNDHRFYRDAAEAQLRAINLAMNPSHLYFNDPAFIRLGLCRRWRYHDQHYHIRIRTPAAPVGAVIARLHDSQNQGLSSKMALAAKQRGPLGSDSDMYDASLRKRGPLGIG